MLPFSAVSKRDENDSVKMHRRDMEEMDVNVFLFVMLRYPRREGGQSVLPVSLKILAKQEALHDIIPPLNHRVSNVNAH